MTNEAVSQARQTIRKLSRERGAPIVVTGCAAQTDPEMFAQMPEVARVIGNHDKLQAQVWQDMRGALNSSPSPREPLRAVGRVASEASGVGGASTTVPDISPHPRPSPPLRGGRGAATPSFEPHLASKIAVSDVMALREADVRPLEGHDGRTRAFLQVQNGCDHRCTFCIIPFGRGNSRSVAPDAVIAQARHLVEQDYCEIVLTGVDLTSYGQNMPGMPKLGALVKRLLKELPELARLRLSSIDFVEADEDLIELSRRRAADAASASFAAGGRRHDPQAYEAAAQSR